MTAFVRVSRLWTIHTLMSLMVAALAVGVAPASATVPTHDPHPAKKEDFTVVARPTQVRPGQRVQVHFLDDVKGFGITRCEAWFGQRPPAKPARCAESPNGWTAEVRVPYTAKPGFIVLEWVIRYVIADQEEPEINDLKPPTGEPAEEFSERRERNLTVLEPFQPSFEVTAEPGEATPGDQIQVQFTSATRGVRIDACQAMFEGSAAACTDPPSPKRAVMVTVPLTNSSTTTELELNWLLIYSSEAEDQRGTASGEIVIPIALQPPVFSVTALPPKVPPGTSVTVAFTSPTPGVGITSCGVTYDRRPHERQSDRARTACDESAAVVLTIPPEAEPGTTIPLDWDLTFESTRRGERGGSRTGRLDIQVEILPPSFAVTVEPASAAPGDPVTVTVRSLVDGVDIVDCAVFFPGDEGGRCQRSSERWLARTNVPADAPPGIMLLRWGVASRARDGTAGATNDAIAYAVRPKPTTPPPTMTTPAPSATRTETAAPAADPVRTTPPDESDQGTAPVPPDDPIGSIVVGPPPRFVAVTEPESAEPGEPVSVAVSPLDPGVEITGCVVAFAAQAGTACRPSGDRWSATVVVPDEAEQGDVPLRWSVEYRAESTGAGGRDNGTIDYRILSPGTAAAPAFSVLSDPAAARAGERVIVAQASLADGVTITSCTAGFDEVAMAECRRTPEGWAAEPVVPKDAQPGRGTILWRLAYQRTGEADENATDGLLSFTVLSAAPDPPPGWWTKLRAIAARILLGVLVFAAFLASPRLRQWARRLLKSVQEPVRTRPAGDGDPSDVDPDSVRIVPLHRRDRMTVEAADPDAPPDERVRILLHKPPPVPRRHEEVP